MTTTTNVIVLRSIKGVYALLSFSGFLCGKEFGTRDGAGQCIVKKSELRKKENTRQPQPGTRISKDKCQFNTIVVWNRCYVALVIFTSLLMFVCFSDAAAANFTTLLLLEIFHSSIVIHTIISPIVVLIQNVNEQDCGLCCSWDVFCCLLVVVCAYTLHMQTGQ